MAPSRSKRLLLLLCLILYSLTTIQTAELAEEDLCYDRSCYPATGNLLVGRKDKIRASSTCGLTGRERYCIVSHLEDQTKCFFCDSRNRWSDQEPNKHSHLIENVVTENYADRAKSWWQSRNGEQNVTINVDFDEEFHVTHFILTFRTFRPHSMYIEHSADYGKTWHTDRYFSYECAQSFPGIPEGPPKKHGDVVCTSKYSQVAPSSGGELVYKVISPHIPTDNPYAEHIAKLLKMTNIRITFTKLHTLGDDLLDYRPEIDEKYYYSLYEVVIRGSCSCYGHAQRCIPTSRESDNVPDMVYGNCDCTHNTKGANCNECQDFYNDLPWKPAIGDQPNECKRCECNGHAASCHFDEDVYIKSGNVSGGVCDDCQHNTQGKNCEQCKPYFFRDPRRPINDPYSCQPCQCDKRGSLHNGICDGEQNEADGLVAGKCHCKSNVDGPHCDRCKNGFWNYDEQNPEGCTECKCNLLGTVNNLGCDKYTGECTCKENVVGENCDTCKPNHYGLSNDTIGCFPCDCDPGGSLEDQCDLITGQCVCREHYSGRKCNTTETSFYCPAIDHHTFEAEEAYEITSGDVVPREEHPSHYKSWTGEGFVRAREGTNITFLVDSILSSGQYNLVFRYELPNDGTGWDNIQITIVRPSDPSNDGPCANIVASEDFLIARLDSHNSFYEVQPSVCLERGVRYEVRVFFGDKHANYPDIQAQTLVDSLVLIPTIDKLNLYTRSPNLNLYHNVLRCRPFFLRVTPRTHIPQECVDIICQVAGEIVGQAVDCECDLTGSTSSICTPSGGQCECKPNVVGRKCDRCAVGTYGFGPNGCSPCDCDSVGALSNACDKQSGQCECRDRGVTGRQCDQCHPGFWSYPDCKTCQCNGHASICDQKTGACIDCHNQTVGHSCDRCIDGYYGDPRLGVNDACKPCPCPGGPGSGFQYANTCYLDRHNSIEPTLRCNCKPGYTGDRCDSCEVNHFGNPREIAGSCARCDCNDNIDRSIEGSCDAKTGHCVKCLYNTDGIQCENCKDGFFGDAKTRNCHQCVCNTLGTNVTSGSCDKVTGQCQCFPNVVGQQCDQCAPNHFDLASGKGCQACECDSQGVILDPSGNPHLECNSLDGKCHCKDGRGGRTCSECEDYYWGNPLTGECKRCECDPTGSASYQCHRNNGTCICRPGSGGPLCNQCARGYTGQWPHCQACGECFDNWDRILQGLKGELDVLVDRANSIEDTGVSSEYDDAFAKMEAKIGEVKQQLESVNISKSDVDNIKERIDRLQSDVESSKRALDEKSSRVAETVSAVGIAEQQVKEIQGRAQKLTQLAEDLNANATQVKASDIGGAYELVQEAAKKAQNALHSITDAVNSLTSSESERNKASELVKQHHKDFESQYVENEDAFKEIGEKIQELEGSLPSLNLQVCGGEHAYCDQLCGGPSSDCGHCGGSSCPGSVSKAQQAKEFAKEARDKLLAKQKEAEDLLQRLRQSVPDAEAAEHTTSEARRKVEDAAKLARNTKEALVNQIAEIDKYLQSERTSPEEIQQIIDQILGISIPFTEEQIQEMSEKIREKVAESKNTNEILAETQDKKSEAERLQTSAAQASKRAADIHNTTVAIKSALSQTDETYNEAQKILDDTTSSNEKVTKDLEDAETDVASLEEKAKEAVSLLSDLQNKTDKLKAEYIKITSNSKAAGASADAALEIANKLDAKQEEVEKKLSEVDAILETRASGGESKQERAKTLMGRAKSLFATLQQRKKNYEDMLQLSDALEVELSFYRSQIENLSRQIDDLTDKIEKKVEYHATCDA